MPDPLSGFEDLASTPGAVGDVVRQKLDYPALSTETPSDTATRQYRDVQQVAKIQRVRAGDLAKREIPSFTADDGTVQPVTDATGAPLTHFDKKNKVAWDSTGNPQKIEYGASGPPVLKNPLDGLRPETDPKTGDQYLKPAGLPWQHVGQDEKIAAELKQKEHEKSLKSFSGLLNGSMSLDQRELHDADFNFRHGIKGLGYSADTAPDKEAALKAVDDASNLQTETAKKAASSFFGFHTDAQQLGDATAQIEKERAANKAKVEEIYGHRDKAAEIRGRIEQKRAVAQQISDERLADAAAKLLDPSTPAYAAGPDDSISFQPIRAYDATIQAARDGAFGRQVTPDELVAAQQTQVEARKQASAEAATAESVAGKKLYAINRDGQFHFDPSRPFDAHQQAVADGKLPPPNDEQEHLLWSAQQYEQAKLGQKPYRIGQGNTIEIDEQRPFDSLNAAVGDGVMPIPPDEVFKAAEEKQKLVEAAGSNPKIKAALGGLGRGAAFLAGAPVGAGVGAELGAEIGAAGFVGGPTGFITVGGASAAGSIIGGLITGSMASWSYGKIVEELGKYNDTINSFVAAQKIHPGYAMAGELAAFGGGLPKAGMKAIGATVEGLADSTAASSKVYGSTADVLRGTLNAAKVGGQPIAEDVASRATRYLDAIAKSYKGGGGGLLSTIESFAKQGDIIREAGGTAGDVALKTTKDALTSAGAMVAIDTALKEGSKALGISDEGQTWGGAGAAALLGAFAAGHGISFKDYTPQEVAEIALNGAAHFKAGVGTAFDIPPEKLAEMGVDPSMTQRVSRPLTPEEHEIFEAFKAKITELDGKGIKLDPAKVVLEARQALRGGRAQGVRSVKLEGEAGGDATADSAGLPSGTAPSEPAEPSAPPAPTPSTSKAPKLPKAPAPAAEAAAPAESEPANASGEPTPTQPLASTFPAGTVIAHGDDEIHIGQKGQGIAWQGVRNGQIIASGQESGTRKATQAGKAALDAAPKAPQVSNAGPPSVAPGGSTGAAPAPSSAPVAESAPSGAGSPLKAGDAVRFDWMGGQKTGTLAHFTNGGGMAFVQGEGGATYNVLTSSLAAHPEGASTAAPTPTKPVATPTKAPTSPSKPATSPIDAPKPAGHEAVTQALKAAQSIAKAKGVPLEYKKTTNESGFQFNPDTGIIRVEVTKAAKSIQTALENQKKNPKLAKTTPEEAVETFVRHEITHHAQLAIAKAAGKTMEEFYDEKTDADLGKGWLEKLIEFRDDAKKMDPWKQKAEYVAAVAQGHIEGKIPESLWKHIKDIIEYLKGVAKNGSEWLKAHVAELEQRVNGMKPESKPEKPVKAPKSEKPAPPKAEGVKKTKAQELGAKLFEGLDADAPKAATLDQIGFPRDRRAQAEQLADALLDEGVKTPEAMAKWLTDNIGEKGRKYSQSLWNALATVDPALTGSQDWAKIYADPEPNSDTVSATMQKPHEALADWVTKTLGESKSFSMQELFNEADKAFGGRQSDNVYTAKDATDAMELGVTKYIESRDGVWNPATARTVREAQEAVFALKTLVLEHVPTQGRVRSEEMEKFQQFSTPPTLAFAANWVANIHAGETAMEPSAGLGSLAIFGKLAGAKVIVNELAPRRAELLKTLGFERVFTEDAEQLNNVLPADVRPSVVVMNPPFSQAGDRLAGKRDLMVGARHIDQMLKRLPESGRLVAIVGRGMTLDSPTFKEWWTDKRTKFTVRAAVGVSGKEYAKYGTTFDNLLLVIDNAGPTTAEPVTGNVDKVEDLIPLLKGVRDARLEPNREVAGTPPAEVGAGETADGKPALGDADAVGVGERPAGGQDGETAGGGRPGNGTRKPAAGGSGRGNKPVRKPVGAGDVQEPGGSGGDAAGGNAVGDSVSEPDQPGVEVEQATKDRSEADAEAQVFDRYQPTIKVKGAQPNATPLAESSAMASVDSPAASYSPKIPEKIIKDGILSDAQLETLVLVGAAHEKLLPGGERQGFFNGDGTGVGKTRQIVGVFLDNWNRGRRKGVWMTENSGLLGGAKKGMEQLGWNPALLIPHGKTKVGEPITAKEGILFSSYTTLASASGDQQTGLKKRIDQITNWLGKDFDGVIAFDEAHKMGNVLPVKGQRGISKPAAAALAGVALQKALPKARVLYMSATGATDVRNLAYAERLGLWGAGTPFNTVGDFVSSIEAAGVAAMEMVARDMKAMGLYLSRNIAFNGVEYDKLIHPLTPEQTEVYDDLAGAWQTVLQNMGAALEETNQGKNGMAKSAANSKFWGAHQRFFNQVMTSMQLPSVIAKMEESIAAGRAVVIQLVNTNEAATKSILADKAAEAEQTGEKVDYESMDFTPRQALMDYVERGFPTQQYEEFIDDNGKPYTRPAVDSQGKPIHNAEAVKMKEALLEKLAKAKVPESPLDSIIDHFGADKVAEVTGRSVRVIRKLNKDGVMEKQREGWSKNKGLADANAFQDDKKQILIFSAAGGTGMDYHADLSRENQRPRDHITLQAGWRADTAVQGFGRTHRNNQKQPPKYYLASTNLNAQKRFVSTIARRLDQLGALTKGQRDTGSQGMMSAADNLENEYATEALKAMYRELLNKQEINGVSLEAFETQTGQKLTDRDGNLSPDAVNIKRFLNRLLNFKVETMNKVWDAFYERFMHNIEAAQQRGELDTGMETIKATAAKVVREERLNEDKRTGATTDYKEVELTHPTKIVPFKELKQRAKEGFVQNIQSGMVWAHTSSGQRTSTKTGAVTDTAWLLNHKGRLNDVPASALEDPEKWKSLTPEEARPLIEKAITETPKTYTETAHMITGALLPIWNRLKGSNRVFRITLDNGERILGRRETDASITQLLHDFQLGAANSSVTPERILGAVKDGSRVRFADGTSLKTRRVYQDERIEITGPKSTTRLPGIFGERISYEYRYFIQPEKAGEAIAQIMLNNPPVEGLEGALDAAAPRATSFSKNFDDADPETWGRFATPAVKAAWPLYDETAGEPVPKERSALEWPESPETIEANKWEQKLDSENPRTKQGAEAMWEHLRGKLNKRIAEGKKLVEAARDAAEERAGNILSHEVDRELTAKHALDAAAPKSTETETREAVKGAAHGPRSVRSHVFASAKAAGGSDSPVKRAVDIVKATGRALGDFFTKLPEVTDYKRAKGEWLGAGDIDKENATGRQRADHEARLMVREVRKKFPDRLGRVAITRYLRAGGDETKLREQMAKTKPQFKPEYERALKLNAAEKGMADIASKFFEDKGKLGVELGILNNVLTDYVNRIWDMSKLSTAAKEKGRAMALGKLATSRLKTRFDNAIHRVFETDADAEALGYVPLTNDIAHLMGIYGQSFNHTIADRAFVKQLTELKATDGRPLVVTSGYAKPMGAGEEEPAEGTMVKPRSKPSAKIIDEETGDKTEVDTQDYQTLDHPALRKWKWAGKDTNGKPIFLEGDLLVHPEIYTDLRNTLGKSWLNEYGIVRAVTNLQYSVKQTMLAASLFHYVQEGTHAIGHSVNPFAPIEIDFSDAVQRDLVNAGLMVSNYNAKQDFAEGLAATGLIGKIPILGKWNDDLTAWLFEDYIPRLKMTMAAHAYTRNLKRFAKEIRAGKITPEQIAQKTAQQANDAFGEQNNRYMGNNPTRMHAERLFFLAPDFLKSRAKFFADAFTKYGSEQRRAILFLAVTMLVTAKLLERMLTGENHWDKPFTVVHGTREYSLRSVPGDVIELFHDPRRFVSGRLSPVISRTTLEWLTGRDYRGVKRNHGEQALDALTQVVPMSLQAMVGDRDVPGKDMALNAAGLRVKRYSEITEARKLGRDWQEKHGAESPGEAFPPSKYLNARQALEDGDADRARKAIAKIMEKEGRRAAMDGFKESTSKPFSGKTATEAEFLRSLDPKDAAMVRRAAAQRALLLAEFNRIAMGLPDAHPSPMKTAAKAPSPFAVFGAPAPRAAKPAMFSGF